MDRRSCLSLLVLALLLAACDLPRDPESTSERVTGGELVIGRITGKPAEESEKSALERILSAYSATPRFVEGEVHHLVADLRDGKVDLLVGRIPEDTPFAAKVGLSKPVGTTQIGGETKGTVFAVRSGENGFLKTINRQIAAGR